MLLFRVALLVVAAHALPQLQTRPQHDPRQFYYAPPQQQYPPNLPYDFGYQGFNNQPYPRLQPQPQIIFYSNSGSGQPFLIQPGGAPPTNFLYPQPGNPNVHRNTPLFVAGYPKPAHIPPIEKDAEEVPTDPARIPPLPPMKLNKGEPSKKLETFDEEPTRPNLRPGQRFFILNGQPLFSNYPPHLFNNQIYPGQFPGVRYGQPEPPQGHGALPNLDQLFQRNDVTGQIDDIAQGGGVPQENLVLLNPQKQVALFRAAPADLVDTKDVKLGDKVDGYEFLSDAVDDEDNEAIIIDAKYQDEVASTTTESESEVVNAEKSGEPTIAQAAPGAIALAGPGGVAAAAPRGTAFVGKDGVAVSSPQATAVAGPNKDESEQKTKKTKLKQ